MHRRDFVRLVGMSTATFLAGTMPAMAGPFESADFEKLIPPDKKLHPDWVKALYERGTRDVYRGDDLKYIGMPIGGLCTGQLYLGGDGKLWYWDIFNQYYFTGYAAPTYAAPYIPSSPLEQGFTLKTTASGNAKEWTLDKAGFPDVAFCGEYPFGFVEYTDKACPVAVSLEAFSPFTPLSIADSGFPATAMRYTIHNTSAAPVDVELTGHLENGAAVHSKYRYGAKGVWQNRIMRDGSALALELGFAPQAVTAPVTPPRPVIVFADFEGPDYRAWTQEGDAFGKGPTVETANPPRVTKFQGKSFANTYLNPGGDTLMGKLTSPEFTIERTFINFLIGGGNKPFLTCINLLVDGNVVRSSTSSRDTEEMQQQGWDVSELQGKKARIQIVDETTGPWGHVEVDQIQFEDTSPIPSYAADMFDYGTMSLALLHANTADSGTADVSTSAPTADVPGDSGKKAIGSVTRKVTLQPGESHTAAFILGWHFPNFGHDKSSDGFKSNEGRFYATRFADAAAVTKAIGDDFDRLYAQTKAWHDTWHDSTLPNWLLVRTQHNVSTLATSTAYHFADGEFYGWEGVGCCGGTCTHVWSYEQAMGRLFPEYDRLLRERMEFKMGKGLSPDGEIGNRSGGAAATDGHAGTILRTYRDHQVSPDNEFLKSIWLGVKLAIGWLIAQDGNNDGLIEGPQPNTMDETWYGASPWMSGLYLAALRAGEEMASDMGDLDFARKCRAIFDVGQKKFVSTLWSEKAGYFIQTRDPQHADVRGSYDGCECDQVYGQSWGFQVGLGRVLPVRETRQALASLYKYNWAPDVGAYSKECGSQAYALPGEAGLIICTWPQDAVQKNECNYCTLIFAGIEHHVAGHMIWEGMLQEGLTLERAIHDRYHPSKRNPWNEVECGDHYARSMASYGVFVALCGFEYHGPRGTMAFAPRLTPENFRSAFTAAEGWGTYAQTQEDNGFRASLELKYGKLELNQLTFTLPKPRTGHTVAIMLDGRPVPHQASFDDRRVVLNFSQRLEIATGKKLLVAVS